MQRAGKGGCGRPSCLSQLIRSTACCLLPAARLAACCLLPAAYCLAPALSWAQSAPPLPRLAIDAYPPAAREAISRAHHAAIARPADGETAGALGRVLHAWEQWGAAREAYARAAALAPRAFDWPYLEAVVLQRLAQPGDAAAKLEAALALKPDYLPARLKRAESLLDAGDLDRSGALFAQLTNPECEPAVQFGLGRIAAARGRQAQAIEHFKRAIALFPEFGGAHYALALAYRATGRREEAQAALHQHALFGARWPALPDAVLAGVLAVREDASALLHRGIKRADSGDIAGAIEAHEAALTVNPSLAQAHANLVSLYGRSKNWAKAEEHYRAVLALGVNVADAHYDYGVLLDLQERWDDAASAYRQAIALNPLHAEAHNNLGHNLERQRKLEEAAAEYQLAVESRPTLRIARFNRGRMLIALGRADDAVRELQPLIEPRDAEAPRYLFALATAYVRAGRRDEGIKWAIEARDLATRHGDKALAAAIDRDLARIR
jgi:tetratricopeptide (TPR) repeat protein